MKQYFFAILIFVFLSQNLLAQESLSLPFFDDFSSLDSINSNLWQTNNCSISRSLAKNPISSSVVCFDAMTDSQNFHKNAKYQTVCPGDTLSSRAINLDYAGDNTIYLSFFVQAGGFGDAPEQNDSLCLDFYSPITQSWDEVWFKTTSKATDFEFVSINIEGKNYLQDGFKFRFRNYFSLGSSNQKDVVSNCDMWFVDYVYLNSARSANEEFFDDISISSKPELLLNDYLQIPKNHFLGHQQDIKFNLNYSYRNNGEFVRLLDSLNYHLIKDKDTFKLAIGSFNVPKQILIEDNLEDVPLNIILKDDLKPDTLISKLYLVTNDYDQKSNNQSYSKLIFGNCYAKDDGSAEAGYGIFGQGSNYAMVAVKFDALKEDYINGVYMYFYPTFNDEQAEMFDLKIWADQDGQIGECLLTMNNLLIDKSRVGQYVLYNFSEPILLPKNYYIGWQKSQMNILNIGLDLNSTCKQEKFFNTSGQWKKSSLKGNIMIRPCYTGLQTSVNQIAKDNLSQNIKIYPNPNDGEFFVDIPDEFIGQKMMIFSLLGRLEKTILLESNHLNINDLNQGIKILLFPNGQSYKVIVK